MFWSRAVSGLWRVVVLLAVLAGFALPGLAEPLPAPSGPVILKISGSISQRNSGEFALFDLTTLEALGPVTIETSTLWTEGVQRFTGVPLRSVMNRVGARGAVIKAVALNEYLVNIPMTDAVADGPILAYQMNGVQLSVRDKGPIWVIYPYDSDPVWRSEVIYARSIWQLDRLEVEP